MSLRSTCKCLFLLVLALLVPSSLFGETFTDSRFFTEQVAGSLTNPMGVAFAPDGRMFVWEKAGRVRIVKNGQTLATPFLDISAHVNRNTDRGLVGLALDPNFATNGFVYLAYVYENQGDPISPDPRTQRVTRVTADPSNPDVALPTETVILGSVTDPGCDLSTDCSPNNHDTHTLDHLQFGPDGKLYVSIGDGAHYGTINGLPDPDRLRAQNLDSLNGKILRINPDGTGPSDNPFYTGNPNANRSKVYDYGLRNPYRFWFDSRDNSLYVGDVGSSYYEEINHGKGQNFGWPCYEGPTSNPDHINYFDLCKSLTPAQVTFPVFSYARDVSNAIVLGPIYDGDTYPAEYKGSVFYLDFVKTWIRRVPITNGQAGDVQTVATGLARFTGDGPVYLVQGPDKKLYYVLVGSNQIWRISATTSGGNRPPQAGATATPAAGLSPLNVTFSSGSSSDPDGDTLSYKWDFGDGNTSTSANPSHTYTASGVKTFTVKLTVTDGGGLTGTTTIPVTVGSRPPTATIDSPAVGTIGSVGQTINFHGSATDPDEGPLGDSDLHWEVLLKHNTHFHVVFDNTGPGGNFPIEEHGGVGDTYSYLVRLTATDSSGLEDVKEVPVAVALPGTDFSLLPASGGSLSATVTQGQTATYNLQVSGPSGFSGNVSFTCTGAPANSTCSVSPTSVSLSGGTAKTFTVSVKTTGTSAALHGSPFTKPWQNGMMLVAAFFGVAGLISLRSKSGASRARRVGLFFTLGALLALGACGGGSDNGGGGNPSNPTPKGTYTVKLNAASGSTTGTVDLGLIVQ